MLPVPAPPLKRLHPARTPPGGVSTAVIWLTPFVMFVPAMVAVGLVRLIAPKSKADWERYLKGLAALLEASLKTAVAYRAAASSRRTSQGPACAHRRPAGATRPGGKPGVSRPAARIRTKR